MEKKKWTIEEDSFILSNYKEITVEEISKKINRTHCSVNARMQKLGIRLNTKKILNVWDTKQIKLLKDNYKILSRRKLSELIGQTDNNIRNKLVELGLVDKNKRKSFKVSKPNEFWTKEKIDFLQHNFNKINIEKIAKELDCATVTIQRQTRRMGLHKTKKILKSTFDFYETEILKNNFQNCSMEKMLILIPEKNEKQILQQARKLKLTTRRSTLPEKIVEDILKKINVDYKKEFRVAKGKYIVDFVISDVAIEVQGDYWHVNPKFYRENDKLTTAQIKNVIRDKEKKCFLENLGYKMLYIWEDELKNNIIQCEEIIKNCLIAPVKLRELRENP